MALIRIPVLLALLLASGPLQWRYAQTRYVLTLDAAISSLPSWLALMALAAVFIVATGFRRDRHHATAILVVEALVGLLIVIVPTLIWSQVLPGPWTQAMGGTTGAVYAQMLGLVWVMSVVRTFRSQRRPA
jgi:hypothetical protein